MPHAVIPLYKLIIPSYLCDVDHMGFSRMNEAPLGHWDIWINVLHRAADSPARLDKLYAELYGPADIMNAHGIVSDRMCEKLEYNPMHAPLQHKPVGQIGRARSAIYKFLSDYRQENAEDLGAACPFNH